MRDRTLFGFDEVAERWGVSQWTVRRAADRGEIVTVNVCARRLVPVSEVQRVEQSGVGTPRARKSATEGR